LAFLSRLERKKEKTTTTKQKGKSNP